MSIRIRHLRLEDFRAFRGSHEFAFDADSDRHIELITGPNGSGKSTVIEALQLCFFGDRNTDNLQSYVNQQLVDEIDVDERVTARISVELFDSEEEELFRISREVSTLKTPTGRTDVVEDPEIEHRLQGAAWEPIPDPEEFLADLIPSETRSFSFYNPEQVLGLNTWAQGSSYLELVDRARELRNRVLHDSGPMETGSSDVGREYLDVLNQSLSKIETNVGVNLSEEYLVLDSHEDEGPLLSKGTQDLISFALILSAGRLQGVDTPVVMDMPFARVDQDIFASMCDLLQLVPERQVIIVGIPRRIDQVATDLEEVVASHHRLRIRDGGSVSVDRE